MLPGTEAYSMPVRYVAQAAKESRAALAMKQRRGTW
jgi:hypothetical protein